MLCSRKMYGVIFYSSMLCWLVELPLMHLYHKHLLVVVIGLQPGILVVLQITVK